MTTDAPEEPKDALPKGQPSEEKKEPSASPKMYTEVQANKLADEKHSTLDTQIAELVKVGAKATRAIEVADKRAEDAEEALSRAAQEREKKELDGIGDNADALSLFHGKRTLREGQEKLRLENAELERKKAEHDEDLKEVKGMKALRVAMDIAAKHKGVEASTLVDLTDGKRESMEKLAKALSGVKPKETSEKPSKPDSGDNDGGGGQSDRYKGIKVLHES